MKRTTTQWHGSREDMNHSKGLCSKAVKGIVTLLTTLPLAPLAATAAKPNVVYLLADNLGWGDLRLKGGSTSTLRIDRLFGEGVRLDDFMG